MGAGSKPLRPWQVCAGDVIGSGKRVEYVFERYGELYINVFVWCGAYLGVGGGRLGVVGDRAFGVGTGLRGTKLV